MLESRLQIVQGKQEEVMAMYKSIDRIIPQGGLFQSKSGVQTHQQTCSKTALPVLISHYNNGKLYPIEITQYNIANDHGTSHSLGR